MARLIYGAYGSNMNREQMARRCPHARVIGTYMLEGYELVFCRVATLKKKKGATVPLVLWELTPACEQALDRYEGYPHLYGKKYFTITWEGKVWRMMIYLMTAQHAAQEKPPTETYRQVIEQGYAEHGFDTTPLDEALRNAHQLLRG